MSDYVRATVGLSFTAEVKVPIGDLPNGYTIEDIDDYVVGEIDSEFGGLDGLDISWIEVM